MRQKESPYLLPEGVFIDNPKYEPATLISPQIIPTLHLLFKYAILAVNFPIYFQLYFNNFLLRLPLSLEKVEGEVLFLQSKITEVLGGSGYNTERLATPYVPQYTGKEPKQYTACVKMSQ